MKRWSFLLLLIPLVALATPNNTWQGFRPSANNIVGSLGGAAVDSLIYQLDLTDGSLTPQTGDAPTFTRASSAIAPSGPGATSLTTYTSGNPALETWPYLNTASEGGVYIGSAVTNYCLQSEDLTTTWTKINGAETITGNSVAAPDGNTTADTIAGTASGHGVEQTIAQTSASKEAVFSVYARASDDSSRTAVIRVEDTGDTEGSEYTIPLVSTWRRYTVHHSFSSGASGNTDVQIIVGDTTGYDVYFWGAQLEIGTGGFGGFDDGTPREYVPTTTTAVTKENDILSLPDTAWPADANLGTFCFWWYGTWDMTAASSVSYDATYKYLLFNNDTTNRMTVYFDSGVDNFAVKVRFGATTLMTLDVRSLLTRNQWHHICLAYDHTGANADTALFIDGTSVGTYTGASPGTPTKTPLFIGQGPEAFTQGPRIGGQMGYAGIKWYDERKDAAFVSDLYDTEAPDFAREYDYGWPAGPFEEPDVVAQFLFDEASGNIVDEVTGVVLTPTGTPTYEEAVTGDFANLTPAINYDGSSDDHRNTSTNAVYDIPQNQDFTIEWVAKLDSTWTSGINYHWSIRRSDAVANQRYGVIMYQTSPTNITIELQDDSNSKDLVSWSITANNDDAWHKYRVTFDRDGNAEIFIDGSSQGTGAISVANTDAITNEGIMMGGQYNLGASTIKGSLAEWRWSNNLTNNSSGPGGG